MEYICTKPNELNSIAEQLLKAHQEARIFAFYGKMGAGKTTFIKSICEQLKVIDTAISPSFGIINEYKTSTELPAYHFDFYRIKSITEFLDLGCEEYFYSGAFCFIEWPEIALPLLPDNYCSISIKTEKDNTRRISLR